MRFAAAFVRFVGLARFARFARLGGSDGGGGGSVVAAAVVPVADGVGDFEGRGAGDDLGAALDDLLWGFRGGEWDWGSEWEGGRFDHVLGAT